MISEEYRMELMDITQVIQMSKLMKERSFEIPYINYREACSPIILDHYLGQFLDRYPVFSLSSEQDGYFYNIYLKLNNKYKDTDFIKSVTHAIEGAMAEHLSGSLDIDYDNITISLEGSLSCFFILNNIVEEIETML
ncbi:hypothetical protein [Virgibacillus salexigens]|uniref:Uncharacterized protein n=1 Tax=Virgibacillus massiliensis TaxID=1462526 RepID=A0A024QI58_9BACI|nr:hypothetical protein [Virgibacillus massiliensis]CDQ41875.1 hypothetical protein BN990_04254 [Virgibacillus massiliensis]